MITLFESLYVGGLDKAMHLMQDNFLELGLKREDCAEMDDISMLDIQNQDCECT